MGGRSTGDIVADLRAPFITQVAGAGREAADRLTELDAEVTEWHHASDVHKESLLASEETLNNIDALRPACPTCGGTKRVVSVSGVGIGIHGTPCPDCVDGKASIEWMAAVFNAIVECPVRVAMAGDDVDTEIAKSKGHNALRDHLRSIR